MEKGHLTSGNAGQVAFVIQSDRVTRLVGRQVADLVRLPGVGVDCAGYTGRMSRLSALRDEVQDCRACELYRDATQAVVSQGPMKARIMLVGEQPGDHEDLEGEPFVGPAGRLLDKALEAAEISRNDVYLTNAVKHFRFERRGKRRIHQKPAVGHLKACHPWLEKELTLIRPRVVVCLGSTAGRSVLGRPVTIGEERGRILEGELLGSSVVITTHPSSLLRLRDRDDYGVAMGRLVKDLRLAGRVA